MSFRKLPAKYVAFILPFVISILMSGIVSAVSTLHTIGPDTDFLSVWLAAWGISWVVAFPVLLVVLPTARRIVFLFVEDPGKA